MSTPTLAIPPDLLGADIVCAGLEDLRAGRISAPALLLRGARERLGQSGIELPDAPVAEPERALYLLLEDADPAGTHARYNAHPSVAGRARPARPAWSTCHPPEPWAAASSRILRGGFT